MSTYRFVTYDVFTDVPFAGNPLAVVFDADALSDAQMQTIAREFNLSETVFVRAPADARHTAARAEPGAAHAFRARMFAPEIGIVEDPATGSAVASFAGVLARFEHLADGWHTLPVLQGVEMGRPSLIGLELEITEGKMSGTRIAGKAVKVSEGTLTLQ